MTTIAELRTCSLRRLRREAYRRMELPGGLRVLARPDWLAARISSFNAVLMTLLCAEKAAVQIDAFIDEDVPSEQGPDWHLTHVSAVLESLRASEGHRHDGEDINATTYDWWVVACVRLAEQCGRPVLDYLIEAWQLYCLDVRRKLAGHRFPDAETNHAAGDANQILYTVIAYITGVDYKKARSKAKIFGPPLFRLLALRNFPEDVARHEPKVERGALVSAGLDPELLVELIEANPPTRHDQDATWSALGTYADFVIWYKTEITRATDEWETRGADAVKELAQAAPWPYKFIARVAMHIFVQSVSRGTGALVNRYTSDTKVTI